MEKRVGETDYLVKTPDRRKTHQLCNLNMTKKCHRLPGTTAAVYHVVTVASDPAEDTDVMSEFQDCWWLKDEEAEAVFQSKLPHLSQDWSAQLASCVLGGM